MKIKFSRNGVSLAVMATVISPLYATHAAFAESVALEEVVVTANRREQSIQDVGVVVQQFSGDKLRELGVADTTDLAQIMPGVYASGAFGGQSQQFTIRGVTQSDYADHLESPVAFYIDEVYIPTPQGQTMAFFDMERVEVLKGPQGTLFGRNATGGLVHTIIAKPDFEKTGGYAKLAYGSYNELTAEGGLNLPLTETVAIRASVYRNSMDSYWDNEFPSGGSPIISFDGPGGASEGVTVNPIGEDLGENETTAARLQLAIEPSENLSLRLSGSHARQEMSSAPYTSSSTIAIVDDQDRIVGSRRVSPDETRIAISAADGSNYTGPALAPTWLAAGIFSRPVAGGNWFGYVPLDPDDLELSSDFARDDANEVESSLASFHLEYQMEGVTFNAISSWQNHDKEVYLDGDGSAANVFGYGSISEHDVLSQEFRLTGETERTRWQTGLFYLNTEVDLLQGLLEPTGSAFANIGTFFTGIPFIVEQGGDLVNVMDFESESYSLFGQVEYDFAERWTFIAGLRYIKEDQEYSFRHFTAANLDNYAVEDDIFVAPSFQPDYDDSRSENLWTGKLQLEYRPNMDLLLYAGLNRGVKAGNYNYNLTFTPADTLPESALSYDPEEILSYEAGFKYSQERFIVNASTYFYDYQDYQAYVFLAVSGLVRNVDAETYGFEIDTQFLVTDQMTLGLSYAYQHAEIEDFEVAPGVRRDVRTTYAPRTQAGANLSYLMPGEIMEGELSFVLNVNYAGEIYHNIRNFDSDKYDARTLANFSANWRAFGETGLALSAYVKNLTDERYGQIGFNSSATCGCNIESYGKPRTYGLSIGYDF